MFSSEISHHTLLGEYTGCPKKSHFQNAAGATLHPPNRQYLAPLSIRLCLEIFFLGRLLRLRIKSFQVISVEKFGHTVTQHLILVWIFRLPQHSESHFLGHLVLLCPSSITMDNSNFLKGIIHQKKFYRLNLIF